MKAIPRDDAPKEPVILRNPSQLLRLYLACLNIDPSYDHGILAMGLELESSARILEAFEGTSLIALNKTEISTALRNLLSTLQIADQVASMYDVLTRFQEESRTRFHAFAETGALLGSYDANSAAIDLAEGDVLASEEEQTDEPGS